MSTTDPTARATRIVYPRLTEARDRAGLTDRQLAALLGQKKSWVRGLYLGRVYIRDAATLLLICKLLGLAPAEVPHVNIPEARLRAARMERHPVECDLDEDCTCGAQQ